MKDFRSKTRKEQRGVVTALFRRYFLVLGEKGRFRAIALPGEDI